jgi:hypothetical protein
VPPSSNNTLRVPYWTAPFSLELCKAVFRGSPCHRHPTTRYACRIGRPRWLGSSWYRVQGLAVLLGHNNTPNVSRALLDSPLQLGTLQGQGSGAHRAAIIQTTRPTFHVRPWAPPLNWIFVKPYSGAHRATVIQQHATRAGSGAPVGSYLCKTGFRGSPCRRHPNNTLNVSCATSGGPLDGFS